jgi:hypothetical protein
MKNKILIAGVTASIWSMFMVWLIGGKAKRTYRGVSALRGDR